MMNSDDRLLALLPSFNRAFLESGVDQGDQDLGESFAAYQKVEALFDLLRRPANGAQSADGPGPGKVLGEFEILRPLASGGMGHVYLARQESLGRLVALKVCKPEVARDSRMKNRFMAEALSLAQLTHPNVVPVLTSGEDQGYLYLAMEYVAGPTLAQVLQAVQGASADSLASEVVAGVLANPDRDENQPCAPGHAKLDRAYQTWVAQTLQQVAQGLAAAHAAGILHRDIKPANVVFAANGVPKIVDFGLARTSQAPSTTVAGEFYGTPAYTSPEQARGDVDEVSPASDVFSFGATLFECLSLDRPFPGRTSADVLSAVLNSDAPLLRRVQKGTPWELEAIADKCLRKSPAERYQSSLAVTWMIVGTHPMRTSPTGRGRSSPASTATAKCRPLGQA
jgi:serine/threonine protein kinase